MPEPTREPFETSEEHLADEIRELERPVLASWRTWAMALTVFAALALVVAAFVVWEAGNIARMGARRIAAAPPAVMSLHTLRPGLESDPRVFRWDAVGGAESYIFIVREAGSPDRPGDVLLIRSLLEPILTTTDVESAHLTAGRFLWSVEARRADGTRVGYGEGAFTIE